MIAFLHPTSQDFRIDAVMREADERGGTFLARLCHAGKLNPFRIRAKAKRSHADGIGVGHVARALQTAAAKSVADQPVVTGGELKLVCSLTSQNSTRPA